MMWQLGGLGGAATSSCNSSNRWICVKCLPSLGLLCLLSQIVQIHDRLAGLVGNTYMHVSGLAMRLLVCCTFL